MTKKKALERELARAGWIKTCGAKHDKWTKNGRAIMVPRHTEIRDTMAHVIRKEAGLL